MASNYAPLPRGGILRLEGNGETVRPGLAAILKQLVRDQGKFTMLQKEVTEAHKDMAIVAADTIAKALEADIAKTGRSQRPRSEASLPALIRNERNLAWNVSGFVVGREGFLESSAAAPYFRNLEEGTRIFVGRELRGFFRNLSGDRFPASRTRGEQRLDYRLIQTNKFFAASKDAQGELRQQAKDGRFRPELQTYGRTRRRLKDPTKDSREFRITIHNPIPAYHYFTQGGLQYTSSGYAKRRYRQLFSDLGIKVRL